MRRFSLLGPLFLGIALSVPASGEIVQRFDPDGKLMQGVSRKAESTPDAAVKYAMPPGLEFRKDVRYEFYPVFGRTFAEIVRSSEENGPFSQTARKRLPSKSEWTLEWSYRLEYLYEIDEETATVHVSLQISDLSVRPHITLTLPGLTDDSALNPIEKTLWESYVARLLDHGHDYIRILENTEAKGEVSKTLTDITYIVFDAATNPDIEKTVEQFIQEESARIGGEWVRKLRRRIEEYETRTEYGANQAARDSFFKK